jgi:hypothetical protein
MNKGTTKILTICTLLAVLPGCDDNKDKATPEGSVVPKVSPAKTEPAKRPPPLKPAVTSQSTPEELGRAVFAALQAKRFANVEPLLAKETDLESVMSANSPGKTLREMFKRNWKRVIAKFHGRARINFNDALERGKKVGIDWTTARLQKVNHRLKVERGMTSATITLHIPHKGGDYAVKLDRVMKSKRGWLLTEIVWLGLYKSSQHWADKFAKPIAKLYCSCLTRESGTLKAGDKTALATVIKTCDQSAAISKNMKRFEAAGDTDTKRLFIKVYAQEIASCNKTLHAKLKLK